MYGDLTKAAEYLGAIGVSDWGNISEADRSAALLNASNLLDALYEKDFIGVRTEGMNQSRAWPRKGSDVRRLGIPFNVVPTLIEHTAYDLAVIWHNNRELFTRVIDPTQVIKSETVGPITTVYAVGDASTVELPSLPTIVAKLTPLLKSVNARRIPVMVV